MNHEFYTSLSKLDGKIKWTIFYVPFDVYEVYKTKGRLKVKVKIDNHQFKGTLLPSKNGHYFVYNNKIKEVCKKDLGDLVHVIVKLDEDTSEITLPTIISNKLDESLLEKFNNLPNYLKREEINKVMYAKKEETRNNRIDNLIEYLSNR